MLGELDGLVGPVDCLNLHVGIVASGRRGVDEIDNHTFAEERGVVNGHRAGRASSTVELGQEAGAVSEEGAFLVGRHGLDRLAHVLVERAGERHGVTRRDCHRQTRQLDNASVYGRCDNGLLHRGLASSREVLAFCDVGVAMSTLGADREVEVRATKLGRAFTGALFEGRVRQVDELRDLVAGVESLEQVAQGRSGNCSHDSL
jgi:hypothetical protein